MSLVVTVFIREGGSVEFFCLPKELCILAYTPPPGPFSSHRSPQSSTAHLQSHLSVGSDSFLKHTRTATGTPGSETPLLLHRSARMSSLR